MPVGQGSARAQVEAALGDYQYEYRELVVRCNALEMRFEDLRTFATAPSAYYSQNKAGTISRIKKELARSGQLCL